MLSGQRSLKERNNYILSYSGHVRVILSLNWKKPENNCLLRQKNTTGIILIHKETRKVKNGED